MVEPRWTTSDQSVYVCYHPRRPEDWFAVRDEDEIPVAASRFLRDAWRGLGAVDIAGLQTDGRDLLRLVAFSAARGRRFCRDHRRVRAAAGGTIRP